MHIVTDVQLIAVAAAAVVHFAGTGVAFFLTLRKLKANGEGIDRNHHDLTGLDKSNIAIAGELVIIRSALTRVQAHLDGRPTQGTRATDRPGPPPMRSPTPMVWNDPTTPRPTM
jgi:hypothetical protein